MLAAFQLPDGAAYAFQDVERFEARDHDRHPVAGGQFGVLPVPITLHTCPAARKPWTRQLGERMIASIAGGTRTWETSRLKLGMPSLFAWYTVIAFGGAVVSKPMPKKTTSRPGFCRATFKASSGE